MDKLEGLWYEQPDKLSKYKRRPEELEEVCYTQFGKIFASGGKFGAAEINHEENEEIDLEESHEGNKFNYIITESDSQGAELLKNIKLLTNAERNSIHALMCGN